MASTNRKLLIIGYLCTLSLIANAAPRTMNEAMNEANKFLSHSSTLRSTGDVQLAYTCPENAYYVFNRPNNEGFVIISGDDRAITVLGYTESGYFDSLALSDNFKYWLSCYENEIKTLIKQGYTPDVFPQSPKTDSQSNFPLSIAPLISTRWSQEGPFNDLCPVIPATGRRTVTGCVATAMAQIMNYYKWPVSCTRYKMYTTRTLNILIDEWFNVNYDWENMLDTYPNTTVEDASTRAVSTLM